MHASSGGTVSWTLGSAVTPSRMFPEYYNDKPSYLCPYSPVRNRTPERTEKIRLPKSDIEFWKFRRFSKNVHPNLYILDVDARPNFGCKCTSEFRM